MNVCRKVKKNNKWLYYKATILLFWYKSKQGFFFINGTNVSYTFSFDIEKMYLTEFAYWVYCKKGYINHFFTNLP